MNQCAASLTEILTDGKQGTKIIYKDIKINITLPRLQWSKVQKEVHGPWQAA